MNINENIFQKGEKLSFALRELYAGAGFEPYRMSKFEEYDLYARNKDFLVSDNVITFTDTSGTLMALKPDVTLSIIKNSTDEPNICRRVYYNENVYRVSAGSGAFSEIMQAGLECFGAVSDDDLFRVIGLAAKSLDVCAGGGMISISDLSLTEEVISEMGVCASAAGKLLHAVGEKNIHEIKALCDAEGADCEKLIALTSVHTSVENAEAALREIFDPYPQSEHFVRFVKILSLLAKSDVSPMILVDFSVTDDVNYYNGIVFKGYVEGIPGAVISGGQYDKLMRKMQRRSDAVGFAVYLDKLERIGTVRESVLPQGDMLNIALPKGRLGEKIYEMFAQAGFECPSILEPNRKLIFENPEKGVRYFWVKPSDVAIYVERGAADIGVAGKDILLEYEPDVYELCDLDRGKCRMAVAAPKGFEDDGTGTLRVATKFANVARKFYRSRGRDIDIIHLNGSIEIAPILGLSDVIVDIVETGTTLKENDLEVIDNVFPISARLIANKSAFRFKNAQIESVVEGMRK